LYYQAGLDPSKVHTVNLTDISEDGMKLSLNSITIYQSGGTNNGCVISFIHSELITPYSIKAGYWASSPSNSVSPKNSNTAIIAGTIGAVLGVCVIGALLWWRFRGKRPSKAIFASRSWLGQVEPAAIIPFPADADFNGLDPFRTREKGHSQPRTIADAPLADSAPAVTQGVQVQGSRHTPYQPPETVTPEFATGLAGTTQALPSQPVVQQPENISPPVQSQAASGGNLDVNHLIELIAARIDWPQPEQQDAPAPPYQGRVRNGRK
jgi:hypothetical protein